MGFAVPLLQQAAPLANSEAVLVSLQINSGGRPEPVLAWPSITSSLNNWAKLDL